MSFAIFTPLFQEIDQLTATFVTDLSAKAITAITPVASAGLALAFIAYGLLIIRGALDMPVADFLGRAIRISLITSIALAGGLYQQDIAGAITTVPDEMAQALMHDSVQGSSAAALIDTAAGNGFGRATEAFDKASFFSEEGFVYALFGCLILIATAVLVAIGGAFILIAKIALAILAGIGPIFIIALLFQPTQRFFEQWSAQVLNYALLIILFSSVFSLLMSMFGHYMADLQFDGIANVGYTLGGAVTFSLISIILLLQLPSIASGLAGGVSLGYLGELRAARGGAMRSARAVKGAYSMARAAPGALVGAATGIRDGAVSVARHSATAGRTAAGYFRGRRAG
jgi:type IV secretion system protein VirB6